MTQETIKDMKNIVMPFVAQKLREMDCDGLGKSDAEEFERDFTEILDLAQDALFYHAYLDDYIKRMNVVLKEQQIKLEKMAKHHIVPRKEGINEN